MFNIQNHYINKNSDGDIVSHTIAIKRNDEYAFIECTILGRHTDKTDDELVSLVLEKFYQDTYYNRAEKETITQLKDINKKQNKVIENAIKTINMTKNSVFELTEFVGKLAQHVGLDLEGSEDVEDYSDDSKDIDVDGDIN